MSKPSVPKLSGPAYDYLGHFRSEKVMRAGHNTSLWADPITAPMLPGVTPADESIAPAEPPITVPGTWRRYRPQTQDVAPAEPTLTSPWRGLF